ncbi:MAG: hypothetical protein JXB32_12315 [Deltaproteobacteria bacterium]|nr:hypothetical protein [Deltaproteobacteria bacterium]
MNWWHGNRGPTYPAAAGHLRCPVCGKVSPAERFEPEAVEQHVLERLERTSYGGRIGFRWERNLDLTDDDWVALQRSLLAALRRVQEAAREAGAEVVEEEDEQVDDMRW